MSVNAAPVETAESAFAISAPEVLLMVVGVVFTFTVFAVFVIVLRKELKRDARQKSTPGD